MQKVEEVGFYLRPDPAGEGFYVLSTWLKMAGGGSANLEVYRHLSWTETIDVMLMVADEFRPGMQIGKGGLQTGLW